MCLMLKSGCFVFKLSLKLFNLNWLVTLLWICRPMLELTTELKYKKKIYTIKLYNQERV